MHPGKPVEVEIALFYINYTISIPEKETQLYSIFCLRTRKVFAYIRFLTGTSVMISDVFLRTVYLAGS